MRLRKPAWWDQPNHPVFIVALVVLLLLSGWLVWWFIADDTDSGGGTPRGAQSSATAAPSSAPETPPEFPDVARQPTKAGLEAAVRYENDAINYAQRTGDLEPLKRVYDLERCAVCASLTEQFENLTSNGRYLVGASYTVVSVTRTDVSQGENGQHSGVVELSIKRDAGRQVGPDGRVLRAIEASPTSIFELTLSFGDGAWRISGSKVTEVGR